jgi:hypothetical protein
VGKSKKFIQIKKFNKVKEVLNMPGLDGTGPLGLGPMTGRGAGFCMGYAVPWGARYYGRGAGMGFGRGFRRMYYATGLPGWARFGYPGYPQYNNPVYMGYDELVEDEKELLSRQAEYLEKELEQVKKRLAKFDENDK